VSSAPQARIIETRKAPDRTDVDPVTLDIIENALKNIREEMDVTLYRSAMSPGIREQHDEYPMIADRNGKMVVGQFGSFINDFLLFFDDTVEEGDVLFTSDPYSCGGAISHANDWLIVLPIFREGLLVGWSSMFGHMTDVGGKVPGSLPTDASSIFEEGVIIPPFKLVRGGQMNDDALDVILNQVRIPEWNRADLGGVIAGCRLAERRILELCERFGEQTYLSALEELLDRNYRAMRHLIQTYIPDEAVTFSDYVDDDGLGFGPYKMQCTMWRDGDGVVLDWEGTDPQSDSSINYLLSENILKMYFGVYMIMVFDPQVLWNDGFYPLVEVRYPKGCLVQPDPPAALSCRTHALGRVFDVLGGLLGRHQPHFLNGAGFSSSPHLMFSGHYPDGEWFQLYQIGFGGVPGRRIGDGPDGHSMWPSFTNVPNEYLERYYPLRIERYTSVADSGGPGLHRGGNGVEVAYRFLESGEVSIHDDRWFTYPWGVNGGLPGERSTKILERVDGAVEVLPSKCDRVRVGSGDLLRYITWGGGGWGDALDRSADLVAEEVQRGLVTRDGATRYGVMLADDLTVDERGTERLREELRRRRPPLETYNFGGDLDTLRAHSLEETGLPAPVPPGSDPRDAAALAFRAAAPWLTVDADVGQASAGAGPTGQNLSGRVAVVTGAASGIGQATAVSLAAAGAKVVIGSYADDPNDSDRTRTLIEASGGTCLVVQADVRDTAAVDALCDEAVQTWGRLDIAVANAAVLRRDPLESLDDEVWDSVLDVNLGGVMRLARAAARHLTSGGTIIAVSSIAGAMMGWSEHAHYGASKASIIGFARSLADELGPRGIRVNVVIPGLIETPQSLDQTASIGADGLRAAVGSVPLRRIGSPQEVADAIRFLASDQAAYITGESVVVDGGISARVAL
jgi:N-methylhydantoinase B